MVKKRSKLKNKLSKKRGRIKSKVSKKRGRIKSKVSKRGKIKSKLSKYKKIRNQLKSKRNKKKNIKYGGMIEKIKKLSPRQTTPPINESNLSPQISQECPLMDKFPAGCDIEIEENNISNNIFIDNNQLQEQRLKGCGDGTTLITDEGSSLIQFKNILRNYFTKTNHQLFWTDIYLYPYINEKMQAPSCKIDKVNCPKLSIDIINIFQSNFENTTPMRVLPYPEISFDQISFTGSYEPNTFFNFIKKETGNHFMVTHSHLLRSLYRVIKPDSNTVKFTNLSCLVIYLQNEHFIDCNILNSEDNWKEYNQPESYNKRIVLMRHCPGCHNFTKKGTFGKLEKRGLSGKYANCLPLTVDFIKNNIGYLIKNVFNSDDILHLKKYRVGCSPSLRTLLTLTIINTCLSRPDTIQKLGRITIY